MHIGKKKIKHIEQKALKIDPKHLIFLLGGPS